MNEEAPCAPASCAPVTAEDVWVQFGAGLRGFVARRVSDRSQVEDLVSEIVLRVHRHLDALDDRERLTAWVFRIARNVINDYYRSTSRRREDLSGTPSDPGGPSAEAWIDDQDAVSSELAVCLRPLLAELAPDYRRALELTDLGGMTQTEAAMVEHVSVSGMKSRVQRGRQQLAVVLQQCCVPTLDSRGRPIDFRPRPDICG
jgi:RNA polymerase sigma-70 factor (ECF subfamily)